VAVGRVPIEVVRCSFWGFTYPYVSYVAASAYVGLLATGACVELYTTSRFPLGVLTSGYSCYSTVIALCSVAISMLVFGLLHLIAFSLLLLLLLLWLLHFFMALSVCNC
jgi:uncharacterized membrane protein